MTAPDGYITAYRDIGGNLRIEYSGLPFDDLDEAIQDSREMAADAGPHRPVILEVREWEGERS